MQKAHDTENSPIQLQTNSGVALLSAPFSTIERYALVTGQDEGVIRGHVDKGYLPTMKFGKRRLINIVALAVMALEAHGSTIH